MFGSSGWNGRFTIWTTAWVALEIAGGDDFFEKNLGLAILLVTFLG